MFASCFQAQHAIAYIDDVACVPCVRHSLYPGHVHSEARSAISRASGASLRTSSADPRALRAASRAYFKQAQEALQAAVTDFAARTDKEGRPLNDRRHWLNFARGIGIAQRLATKIQTSELKDIWSETEHYWRSRTYDLLDPNFESFPAEYYGYTAAEEMPKNFAQLAGEWAPLSEPSLAFVYRWIKWPADCVDTLDRGNTFSDNEIVNMELFGPRGLATQLKIRRAGFKPEMIND